MITDKSFTPKEFDAKVKELAQELANRCSEKVSAPVELRIRDEGPSRLITIIQKSGKTESYQLTRRLDGKVETISVYTV